MVFTRNYLIIVIRFWGPEEGTIKECQKVSTSEEEIKTPISKDNSWQVRKTYGCVLTTVPLH